MTRVLVIEDNPTNLQLMVYLLQAFGYIALEAGDGEQGLSVANRESPDLILCDLQMPVLDGYEVARQLKHHPALRNIPLIAVTAFAMVGDRDKVLAAGFDGYIAKPIVPETFIGLVESFLRPDQRPAPPQPFSTPSTSDMTSADSKGIRILAVDNVAANRELIHNILEPFGYEVTTVSNVAEALSLARQSQPDLIMSDLHMPEQDGFDLIKEVKADPLLRRLKVVIHSATVMSQKDEAKALELGAILFIRRPTEPEQLLREVEECLRKS